MRCSFQLVWLIVGALLAMTSPAFAQKTAEAEAKEPAAETSVDPAAVELLLASAKYVDGLSESQVDVVYKMHVKADEEEDSQEGTYTLRRGSKGKFALLPDKPEDGIVILSDGIETFMHIPSIKSYTLTSPAMTLIDFIKSDLSMGLHNGLGRVALGVMHPQTAADMGQNATSAEIVGEEKLGDIPTTRARFVIRGMTWDMWFAQGEAPVVLRLSPDMQTAMAPRVEAQGIKEFVYEAHFDYANWNTTEPLAKDAFLIQEPEDAELVEQFGQSDEGPHPLLGLEAPEFTLSMPDGTETPIAESLGKEVIVLDFWATWCGPCVMALPIITEVTGEFADKGVKFYAVNQREEAAGVQEFLDQKQLTMPVLLDADGEVANKFSVEGLPTTVIIGKDGKVQVVHVGLSPNLKAKLTEELTALVAGEDLAASAVAERKAAEAKQAEVRAGREDRNTVRRKGIEG